MKITIPETRFTFGVMIFIGFPASFLMIVEKFGSKREERCIETYAWTFTPLRGTTRKLFHVGPYFR